MACRLLDIRDMHDTIRMMIEDVRAHTLVDDGMGDLCRRLVCSRTVLAAGTQHFRLSQADDAHELDAIERGFEGRCACGAPLSYAPLRSFCRRCDPSYRSPDARSGERGAVRYGVARDLSRRFRQWLSTI